MLFPKYSQTWLSASMSFETIKFPFLPGFEWCFIRQSTNTLNGYSDGCQRDKNPPLIKQKMNIKRRGIENSGGPLHFNLSFACIEVLDTAACSLFPYFFIPSQSNSCLLTVEEESDEVFALSQNENIIRFENSNRLCPLCSNESTILCIFIFTTMGLIVLLYIFCRIS